MPDLAKLSIAYCLTEQGRGLCVNRPTVQVGSVMIWMGEGAGSGREGGFLWGLAHVIV